VGSPARLGVFGAGSHRHASLDQRLSLMVAETVRGLEMEERGGESGQRTANMVTSIPPEEVVTLK
jgi:hypothetical protein